MKEIKNKTSYFVEMLSIMQEKKVIKNNTKKVSFQFTVKANENVDKENKNIHIEKTSDCNKIRA